jgi:hypothetical protein
MTFYDYSDINYNFSKATEDAGRNFLNQPFTTSGRNTNLHENGWLIRHLKFVRAHGPYDIQNSVLQNIPLKALKYTATIYNASIKKKNISRPSGNLTK